MMFVGFVCQVVVGGGVCGHIVVGFWNLVVCDFVRVHIVKLSEWVWSFNVNFWRIKEGCHFV